MKKILLLLFFLSSASLFAQNEDSSVVIPKKTFTIETTVKLGFGELNSTKYHNLTGSTLSGELLVGYSFSNRLRLKSGIDYVEFSNSSLLADGSNTSLKSAFIQVPLKLSLALLSFNQQRIQLATEFGILGSYNLENKFDSTLIDSQDKNTGWHFGSTIGFGLEFKISKDIASGFYVETYASPSNMAKSDAVRLNANQIKFSVIYCL